MASTWRKLFRNLQENPSSVLYDVTDWALSHQRPQFAQLVGRYGARPDFLILGVQRGGTTSLYHYLSAHPQISTSVIKEIHYFDLYYDCGDNWYGAHFAPPWWLTLRGALAGEATPYYLYTPAAAARVAALIPDVRLIVLLREPVRRAYSQYHMAVRQGMETYSFSEATEREANRLQTERDTLGEEAAYAKGRSHRHHSYTSRGHYAEQLATWFEHFPREQFLILESEEFFAQPVRTCNEVQDFLGLPHHDLPTYRTLNDGSYAQIDPVVRERLKAYFTPYNARLEELLGRKFWSQLA